MPTFLIVAFAALALSLAGCREPTFLERSQQYAALVDEMASAPSEKSRLQSKADDLYSEHKSRGERYDFCSEARRNFERANVLEESVKVRWKVLALQDDINLLHRLVALDALAPAAMPASLHTANCPGEQSSPDAEVVAAAADARVIVYLAETKALIVRRYDAAAPADPRYKPTMVAQRAARERAYSNDSWSSMTRAERSARAGDDASVLACMDAALLNTPGTAGVPSIVNDTLTLCRRGLAR